MTTTVAARVPLPQDKLYLQSSSGILTTTPAGYETRASLAKAWTSRACLESCRLARDVFGGAGLLLENRVAMLLADAEAIYTY